MRRVFMVGAALALMAMSGPALASDNIDGEMLYQKNCAFCHGANGEPTALGKELKPFPARNHRAIAKYAGRDELRRFITYGVKGTAMTPKKYYLDPLEIEAVIDFIKTFDYTANRVNGKKRFQAVCATCHGADGRAQTGIGAKNLIYSKLDMKGIVHTMRYGRPGTLMTSKRHQLSNTDIADVADYVYSLRYLASPVNGKKLYSKNCISCHATPRDIKLIGNAASKRTLADLDDHLLDLRIRHGRHVRRAGENVSHLSSDEVRDVMSYIRHEVK